MNDMISHSDRLHRAMSTLRPSWQACPEVYCGLLRWFGLREVASLMLAWSVMIRRGGARAGPRGHSVISILLVAQNQHQATTIQADLLWQWIARDFLVGKKGFHSIDALRFGLSTSNFRDITFHQ